MSLIISPNFVKNRHTIPVELQERYNNVLQNQNNFVSFAEIFQNSDLWFLNFDKTWKIGTVEASICYNTLESDHLSTKLDHIDM